MRQLILKVPKGNKEKIQTTLLDFNSKNSIYLELEDHDAFILYLPNEMVNDFLERISDVENPEISLIPRGVINLYPPPEESPDQVADVQPKSSLEIYLGGIQSVGSMFGFLGYAFAAGLIVWIGFYTTTVYLLVAAMLIAPYAGPAMNAALATASGKSALLKSSLKRYGIAIFAGALASFLLTVLFPMQSLTPLMVEVSHVSAVAIFLPLISGFAGAINICQSERDSLVSGAAVGILVAASLAPPVGLIGVGLYLMDWEIVYSSLFRIALQLLGIHLAATLVFYFYGKVSPNGIRFMAGSWEMLYSVVIVVALGIGGLMVWQFSKPPYLRKASMNTELTEILDREMKKMKHVELLEKEVSFTKTKIGDKPVVKFGMTVLSLDTIISSEDLEREIINFLKEKINVPQKNVYKVYDIKVATD